jgi:putative transcriptional regulator
MDESTEHRIEVHLDELVAARDMTLVELSAKVGVTVANLSILKNGHARAVRFTTLTAICDLAKIPVPPGPHGLNLFPQPGRYSLGHTDSYR